MCLLYSVVSKSGLKVYWRLLKMSPRIYLHASITSKVFTSADKQMHCSLQLCGREPRRAQHGPPGMILVKHSTFSHLIGRNILCPFYSHLNLLIQYILYFHRIGQNILCICFSPHQEEVELLGDGDDEGWARVKNYKGKRKL